MLFFVNVLSVDLFDRASNHFWPEWCRILCCTLICTAEDFVSSPVRRVDVGGKVGSCLQDVAAVAAPRSCSLSCICLVLLLWTTGLFVFPHGQKNTHKSYNHLKADTGTTPIGFIADKRLKKHRDNLWGEKKNPKMKPRVKQNKPLSLGNFLQSKKNHSCVEWELSKVQKKKSFQMRNRIHFPLQKQSRDYPNASSRMSAKQFRVSQESGNGGTAGYEPQESQESRIVGGCTTLQPPLSRQLETRRE